MYDDNVPYQIIQLRDSEMWNYASIAQCLASLCKNLAKKGCNVMTTNSDLPEVAKIFGGGWKIFHVAANRAINSNASRRTGHKELLLKNY